MGRRRNATAHHRRRFPLPSAKTPIFRKCVFFLKFRPVNADFNTKCLTCRLGGSSQSVRGSSLLNFVVLGQLLSSCRHSLSVVLWRGLVVWAPPFFLQPSGWLDWAKNAAVYPVMEPRVKKDEETVTFASILGFVHQQPARFAYPKRALAMFFSSSLCCYWRGCLSGLSDIHPKGVRLPSLFSSPSFDETN